MKLTFPSFVFLDLFYDISSENPEGGDNQECLKEVQAIRQAERSLWVPRPRRILSRSMGAYEYIRTFPVAMTKYQARNERKGWSWLNTRGFSPSWQGGVGARRLFAMTNEPQVHISFQGARKQRQGKTVLSWIVPLPLYPGWDSSSGMLPSTLKTGTSP